MPSNEQKSRKTFFDFDCTAYNHQNQHRLKHDLSVYWISLKHFGSFAFFVFSSK